MSGGSAPGAFADGTLFSGGSTVFSDSFDAVIQVSTTAAVPEPTTVTLCIGLALAGLVARVRRRRRS